MLHIAVITDIVFVWGQIITFIILVECIGNFQITHDVEIIVGFQTSAEITITVFAVSGLIPFAEIITSACSQFQLFNRSVNKTFFHIPCAVSEDGCHISFRYVVRIGHCMLHIRLAVEFTGFETESSAISLVVMFTEAAVYI